MLVEHIDEKIDYDGSQLSPHWSYINHGLLGDSLVSFIGACDVRDKSMLDLEDLRTGQKIFSLKMLHFLCETFASPLKEMIFHQQLFAATVFEEVSGILLEKQEGLENDKEKEEVTSLLSSFCRDGDDLYFGERKFSISIASTSPVSSLFHFALNICSKDVPVPAIGLEDIGVSVEELRLRVGERIRRNDEIVSKAMCKVRVPEKN